VTPTPLAAGALAVAALVSLILGPLAGALAAVVVVAAVVADALAVRGVPAVTQRVAPILARGVTTSLSVAVAAGDQRAARIRQPAPAELAVEPRESDGELEAALTPRRRGRQTLPAPAVRRDGPLGLGRWHHRAGEPRELIVYPDYPAARRLALAVRQGRFRQAGRMTRGPLGLGTDFEAVRDYLPDDDIRQVNWPATERMGRPMSNQFRVEQDREVLLAIDAGRLMAGPIGDATRLDVAVDAAICVALVADVLGDRAGVLAFDREIRRHVTPRRAGGDAVVRALFDLEPRAEEPDYELAFRAVEGGKRSLIVVFCDLLEESAARPLIDAMSVLTRRHAVIVATATDPDLQSRITSPPEVPGDVYAAGVALEVLAARARAVHALRGAGARVVEAPAGALGAACAHAYLTAKARARL